MTAWLWRTVSLLALAGLCAAVWFGGPLIVFDGSRPLSSDWLRLAIIGVIVIAIGGVYLLRGLHARSAQKALEAAAVGGRAYGDDAGLLETGMLKAIATLKRASGRRNFLYEVPWYVIIGPPGAGKTTALVNSGLKFPLAVSGTAQPVPGVGGTRNCDWWFTDDAVLIDTAGRYTTQDSDAEADRKDWLVFLSLLKKHRGRQPINGIIVAISLSDLLAPGDQDAGAHAIEIGNRLQEISEVLKIRYPIYVLFTKADLVAGFMECFGAFDEDRRRMVWGATFQAADDRKPMVGEAPAEFDALVKRLSEEVPDLLQQEPDPLARIAVSGFVAQFGSLRQRVTDFLVRVFDPAARQSSAVLRGFYFSSGTQEGTPIDRVLGAMGRSFGSASTGQMSGTGKSFFLHDLLARVIFAEAGWVSHDDAADRRARLSRYAGIGAVALLATAGLAAMGASYTANRSLIAATGQAAENYSSSASALLTADEVADTDLENVIDALEEVRNLPAGYESRDEPTPPAEMLGMSQRPRLHSATATAYGAALERMLRPRLLLRVEQTLEARMNDPTALYEALKIYLMLGGKAPRTDDEQIVSWMKADWERNRYPGPQNREGRLILEKHLRAMLALDDGTNPSIELDRAVVEAAQRALGRMTVADRASALISSATSTAALSDFSVAARGGAEAKLVFETIDGSDLSTLRIPGLYGFAGFNDFYLDQMAGIAQKLADEQWVLGAGAEQGDVEQELLRLGPELLERYSNEFARTWNDTLDRLKFRPMSEDKPEYLALSAAGSASSPLAQLFEAIARETALTRATGTADVDARAEGLSRIGIELAGRKSSSRAGAAFANAPTLVPGANIEAQFRPFQLLVDGRPGQRPIDALIQNFHAIYQNLTVSAAAPARADRVNANLQLQISNLRANASRLPRTLARMVHAVADDFEGDVAETSLAQLGQMLEQAVSGPCEEAIANRYPFGGGSTQDVPIADFSRLFAPGGILDRFFAQNLASFADMSGQEWQWKQESRLGRGLSKSTLKQFQLASEIRDTFFPLGGSTPAVNLTFTPFSLHGDADMALLDVNGQVVQSYQNGSSPGTVTWPGSQAAGAANLSLTPELPGRDSALRFEGPWALKRLLDAGTSTLNGDKLELRFVIGGRDVAYTVQVNPPGNPFSLPAFSGFTCPKGL
ncbi:type VI secretion system membrane subunit TssM [Aminobacter aganoensis]|uniref:Type VI secretion system protein ImpL n=1 Tax=Aminobacter aganoensis TaxID=83264 RepID=A0A7X0F3I5_9HYPH|nr:type VI secretion system membrane subunit TssM [Aminobacter aganoensis]MBB6352414.1 type VI secretion system protein ImpL [Aminobacter aganoensis]